jgi:hypothetical protein
MGDSLTITELDTATTAWIDQEAQRSGTTAEVVARRLSLFCQTGRHRSRTGLPNQVKRSLGLGRCRCVYIALESHILR